MSGEVRIRIEQAKVLACLRWIDEIYNEICRQEGVDRLPSEHAEFDKLIDIIKEYMMRYGLDGWFDSPKYRSALVHLNRRLGILNKKIPSDLQFYPIVLAVGVLRHAPLDKAKGFEKIEDVDLDALILWARGNEAFKWEVQKYCQDFKKYYWEA